MGLKGHIICFCGPDGSGKSTLAKVLLIYLRPKYKRLRVSWLRGTHTLSSVIARFIKRFEVFKGPCNPYHNICIPKSMVLLWLWLELISVLPIIIIKLVIPKMLGYVIIAERGIADFAVWLIVTLRRREILKSSVFKITLSLIRAICDYSIYIRAEEDILIARRKGWYEEYLIPMELMIYDKLARVLNLKCIDTSYDTVAMSLKRILVIINEIS